MYKQGLTACQVPHVTKLLDVTLHIVAALQRCVKCICKACGYFGSACAHVICSVSSSTLVETCLYPGPLIFFQQPPTITRTGHV